MHKLQYNSSSEDTVDGCSLHSYTSSSPTTPCTDLNIEDCGWWNQEKAELSAGAKTAVGGGWTLSWHPQSFIYFLIKLGKVPLSYDEHVPSSKLNTGRYFPSMFYRQRKITFLNLGLHSPCFTELCHVSKWTRHNILACKTFGLLQITLNWVMECILEAVTTKIRLSNDLLGSSRNF